MPGDEAPLELSPVAVPASPGGGFGLMRAEEPEPVGA
jgi:hypothetical protein